MTQDEIAKRAQAAREWLENKAYVAAHEDELRELIGEWTDCSSKKRRDAIWHEVQAELSRYSRIELYAKEDR